MAAGGGSAVGRRTALENHDVPRCDLHPTPDARFPLGALRALQRGGQPMTLPRRRFLCLASAAAGLSTVPLAWADDYPTRSVTIVVPFTPAGSTDMVARMLAQKLEQRLGKSFVVENRPGAGTLIAASAVAKAPADGYVLFMAPSSTMATNVTLYR